MMNISREEPENSKELAKVTQQLAQLLKPKNGKDGADGRDIEIRVTADFIQARLMGDAWNNLISVADLKGDKGDKGLDGKNGLDGKDGVGKNGLDGKNGLNGKDGKDGKDGDQLRLRKDRTHIQWKLDNDTEWKNLVSLEELRGPAGVNQVVYSGGGNAGQASSGETPPPSEGAVDSVNGQTGVVVLDQDDVPDGSTNKQYSQTEKTKLAGIETGAEVNNISDANATDLTDGGATTLHTHTVTKSDVGLGSVDNTADTAKPVSTAQQTALDLKENLSNKDTDITLAADSDTKYPSQKATKAYVDSKNRFMRYLKPHHWAIATTSATYVAGTVYLMQIDVPRDCTVDGINISNAATIAGNVRAGLYGPISLTTENPNASALVAESASTAQSGANASQFIPFSTPVAITKGKYYLALQVDNATATINRHGNVRQVTGWTGTYARSGGYGAFTNPCPTYTDTPSNMPGMVLRVSV